MKLSRLCVALVLWMSTTAAWCESVRDCEGKSTKDAQYLCTAVSMVNPVICDQISSRESMFFCRAMVANNSYACDKIDSSVKRQSCLMAVRDKQRGAMWAVR